MQTSAEKSKDSTVSCYTCGVEGHKIPQCPSKKTGKVTVKKIGSVAVKRCDKSHIVNGFINGKEVPVLLDSGAMITVVPEPFVAKEQYVGENTTLHGFNRSPVVLPLANVVIQIGKQVVKEHVAVAPVQALLEERVLLSLNLKSSQDLALV